MLILWEEEVVCCLFTLTFTVHKLFAFLNWYLNSWVLLKMSEECRVQENSHGWFLFLHLLTHIAACGSFYGESWPSRSRWLLYKQHSWPILTVKYLKLQPGLIFSSQNASFGLTLQKPVGTWRCLLLFFPEQTEIFHLAVLQMRFLLLPTHLRISIFKN